MRDRAREFRKEQTPAEKALWEVLRQNGCGGLRFLRQRPMGPYILDFYCPARKLAIEVDGGIHEQAQVWAQDMQRQQALEEIGITVIRLTNEEVLAQSRDDLVAQILKATPPR